MKKKEQHLPFNQIYNEDCLIGLKKIPDKSIDLIVTDPPYVYEASGMKNGKPTGILKGSTYIKEIIPISNGFDLGILDECMRVMKRVNAFFFCSKAQIPMYTEYFEKFDNVHLKLMAWNKTDSPPLCCGKYLSDTEYIIYAYEDEIAEKYTLITDHFITKKVRTNKNGTTKHVAMKPVDILKTMIESASSEEDCVLEPFMGSGSTAVACIESNRRYIGFEIDKDCFDMCLLRTAMAYTEPLETEENTHIVCSVDDVVNEDITLACIDVSNEDAVRYDFIESIIAKQSKPNLYITLNADQILDATLYFSKKGYKYDILSNYQHNGTKHVLFLRKGGVKLYGNYHSKRKWFVDNRTSSEGLPYTFLHNLITNSTKEGDTVFLYGDYGTGIEVCKRENRQFIVYAPNKNDAEACIEEINKIDLRCADNIIQQMY